MISKNIQNIIVKYLNSQATMSELENLEFWLSKSSNEEEFLKYVKINYLVDYNMKKFNSISSRDNLLEFINKEKKNQRVKKLTHFIKYAAIVIILVTIGYKMQNNYASQDVISNQIITLQQENGQVNELNDDATMKVKNSNGDVVGFQNGNKLVYNANSKINKIIYNTIKVPFGKLFEIQLSDGTKVTLNAGTSLKYPVKFIEGEERIVFIEHGEAYFDVTKDPKHPFIVKNKEVSVEVLGTQFNVSAYPEDTSFSTVLVEGSVSLYKNKKMSNLGKSTILSPGYKASWSLANETFKVSEADVELHTAWLSGRIILKHTKFNTIIKKLERHYNVEIINNDEVLGNELITATFDIETIEEVLEVINEIHPINYEITDSKIVINKIE